MTNSFILISSTLGISIVSFGAGMVTQAYIILRDNHKRAVARMRARCVTFPTHTPEPASELTDVPIDARG